MKREVLAGAVLDLHQSAGAALFVGKRCVDCAHHIPAEPFQPTSRCSRSVKVSLVDGTETHWTCAALRESDLPGDCGPRAIHFLPTEAALAARSVRRISRLRAIEDAIVSIDPDAMEAEEILDALTAAIKSKYEDHATDALEQAADFRQALEELESVDTTPAPRFG